MQTLTSPVDPDATVERLEAGIEAAGLRVAGRIDGQANAARMGREVPADRILEVFRPDFAIRVWAAEKAAGIDIPLRIHIYAAADGSTRVALRRPGEVFAPWDNPELDAIGAELEPLFDTILARLEDDR